MHLYPFSSLSLAGQVFARVKVKLNTEDLSSVYTLNGESELSLCHLVFFFSRLRLILLKKKCIYISGVQMNF